jgi:hypothetical protein
MNSELLPEFWMPIPWSGCWQWLGNVKHGEGRALVTRKQRKLYASRVFYEHYCAPIPDGMVVCHRCDNPGCVNPAHLFLGTQADNLRDMARKGRRKGIRSAFGEASGQARLSEADVRVAREMAHEGRPQQDIAERLGIAQSSVSRIVNRKNWTHI